MNHICLLTNITGGDAKTGRHRVEEGGLVQGGQNHGESVESKQIKAWKRYVTWEQASLFFYKKYKNIRRHIL